jgi:TfoX/Sxy family transcriptional regulator of competence genes
MAYNKEIETRINKISLSWKNIDNKKMFGGVCCLLNGNMFCGVHKDFLILRLGEKISENTLELPHVRPFDITGKPMKGWVMVEQEGFRSDSELRDWLKKAKEFVKTLPSK